MKNYIQRRNNDEYSLFDEAINNFFRPLFYSEDLDSMKTDIKELDKQYEMEIEMPGFDKKDIAINLEDGYLNVSARKEVKEEKGAANKGNYIKKERTVSCSRSYYVGDLKEEEVKAKYENGVLCLTLPKVNEKKPERKQISID